MQPRRHPLFLRLASKMKSVQDIEYLEAYLEAEAEQEARMAENRYISNTVKAFFLVLITVGFIAAILWAAGVEASSPRRWMYLMEGASGLDFYCTDTMPYRDTTVQSLEEWSAFAAEAQNLLAYAKLVEVTDCNLDVLYQNDGGEMFVWRFTERVTEPQALANRHMTRGVAWIQLLDFDINPND